MFYKWKKLNWFWLHPFLSNFLFEHRQQNCLGWKMTFFWNININIKILFSSFLQYYECVLQETGTEEVNSIASWKHVFLNCRNLLETTIPSVMCDPVCRDPTTCQSIDTLKGVAVLANLNIIDRFGNSTTVSLPVACKCIVKKQKLGNRCTTFLLGE